MHYQLVRLLIHHSSDSMADILLFIILAQKLSSDIVARGLKVGRNLFNRYSWQLRLRADGLYYTRFDMKAWMILVQLPNPCSKTNLMSSKSCTGVQLAAVISSPFLFL